MRVRLFSWSRPVTGARSSANTLARLGVFAVLVLLLAAAINFGSSAKSAARKHTVAAPPAVAASNNPDKEAAPPTEPAHLAVPFTPPLLLPQATPTPTPTPTPIETYNCTTGDAQDVFELGDRVCARATGVPAVAFPEFSWRVIWVDPAGVVEDNDTAATNPSTEYDYTLPGTDTTNIGGTEGILVNNRGTWRVLLTRANARIIGTAYFTVRSTARPVADIYVQKFAASASGAVGSGDPIKFIVVVANSGPNDAANVHLTDSLPGGGASLASFSQVDGPTCTAGTSPQDCTIATLASGARAEFEAIYLAGSTIGTYQTTAAATTDTAELSAGNNTGTGSFDVVTGGTENTCALECPNDIVVVANTEQGGNPGAIVNFGSAESFGDCGAITATPASGTFFAVGTTSVTISSAEGGGSCSFSVTVTQDPPPDISCPAPVTATAGSDCTATVSASDLGTPTTTGGTGTVTTDAIRSDNQALDAPYPVGTTTITYTATDSIGRIDACTQTVTVSPGNDTADPTITAPADLTLSTGASGGACGLIVGEAQLGQAEAADDGCSVTITRTGVPAGNFFPVGTTTITWKATDAAGKTATDTQTVTITEDTPPSIQAPPDASYTCLSEVPAADPSQANGGDPNLPDGGPVTDNCGVPVVTVTETRSGIDPLVITRTFKATDASGNFATSVQTILVTDSAAPTISCPADITVYLPLNTTATSTVVNYTTPVGSDNCSGSTTTQTAGLASGASFPVGTTTNTFRVTDAVGHFAECSFNVTVLYDFSGFFQPVDNLPVYNEMKAGQGVPVKFSLSGDKGLNIFAANSPTSIQVNCTSGGTINPVEETVTAGNSSLSYDPSTDRYIYVWKTQSAWKNTCRQLNVTLNDGTTHSALFKFK